MGRDPVEYLDGLNLYGYLSNSPMSGFDPDGLNRREERTRQERRKQRVRRVGLFDARGWELFNHWLDGSGRTIRTTGGVWGTYMESNRLLPPQIAEQIRSDARERSESGSVNITFHANIENGYTTGYEMLHGSNGSVGDFEISGDATMAEDGCGVEYNLTYTWHDIIDPNPTYAMDTILSRPLRWFFDPKDYEVHLSWRSSPSVVLDADGNIESESGYPFD